MILIPVESDEQTIAKGFRKVPMFVFIDPKSGIVVQENHFRHEKSPLFFEHFQKYNVEQIYLKDVGHKTFLKLQQLGIKVYVIPEYVTYYTHIDPQELILLTDENASEYCTMGHHNKEEK